MILWGVNGMNHDAAITSVDSETGDILFAAHAERYSRVKNDIDLNSGLVDDALKYGKPDKIIWHENPLKRKLRYLKSGQWNLLSEPSPRKYLNQLNLGEELNVPMEFAHHHGSHAAGGYFTSGYEEAAILVIDAVGELETASIWHGEGPYLIKKWSLKYPSSIGLFYSAVTQLVGLKPDEEEYILMGMSAYGNIKTASTYFKIFLSEYFDMWNLPKTKFNFHKGFNSEYLTSIASSEQGKFDLALAAQMMVQTMITDLARKAQEITKSKNLVYSGGVALNCLVNTTLYKHFENIWIMPNPGDAGNSLGAIAYNLKKPLKWKTPFLGHDITRPFSPAAVVAELLNTGICGVATGRAEFGPRALGNRSLLADPRREDIKDKVNEIKRRQKFRPFAPAVLEHHTARWFKGPVSPYMQFTSICRSNSFPSITHVDNSSRVQSVGDDALVMKAILQRWLARTGCPILLNTSLNIKGEPLVNTVEDAERWEKTYGVTVF